jgi:FkbM family methyltransferase
MIKSKLGLIISAIMDTVIFGFHPNSALSPKSYFSGVVCSKKFNCSWSVRKGTDDIYNIMPEREGDVHELICSSLERGDIFVDVGANIGYYTILGSKLVGSEGLVVAFEPMPETLEILKINCTLNHLRNVTIIPKAAWSDECMMPLHFSGGYYGMASMTQSEGDSISIKAIPLDPICKPYSTIKMLKIDAEGAEYQILSGAIETLNKTKYVVLECAKDCDKIMNLLQESGFNIRKLHFTTYILAERQREHVSNA